PLVLPIKESRVPVFAGLDAIATNLPTYLHFEYRGGPMAPVADLPPTIAIADNVALSRQCFAAGGQWAATSGRALFLADHSLFINCMLLQEDNDNAVFAHNCLEWLVQTGDDS